LLWFPAVLSVTCASLSASAFAPNAIGVASQSAVTISPTVLFSGQDEDVNEYHKGSGDESIGNKRQVGKDAAVVEVVMKFGGSSLADASRVDHVAKLIKRQIEAGYRPRAVVCSAMGKTTNALLSAGNFALGTYVRTRRSRVRSRVLFWMNGEYYYYYLFCGV